MNRHFKLWPTISSKSTKRTITEKDKHIIVFAITFSGYTQSQKIVNQRIKILGIKKIKMSSLCSQTWLRSPMSERGDPYVWYVGRDWRYQRGGQNP